MPNWSFRLALTALLVQCALQNLCWAQQGASLQADARPRLVVIISVDQLAEWTYREARPFFGTDGFLRLEREGLRFSQCAFRHAVTQTAPGHATISTGADPAVHGIAGNNWHDNKGAKIYCCADANAKTPIGANAGAALSPAQLCAPTIAERMRAHFGAACLTASVAWKDRTAILLGGRTQLALWIDNNGSFTSSTAWVPELPPWVVALNTPLPVAAKHSGKVWTRCGPPAAYANLVDDRAFEPLAGGTRTLPRPIGKPDAKPDISAVGTSPYALDVVVEGVSALLQAMPLGQDEIPDFLGVGFSSVDAVGHNFDPTSVETRDVILATDLRVAAVLKLIDQRVGLDNCIVVLCADHGITPAPEVLAARGLPGARGSFGSEAAKLVNHALIAAFGGPTAPHKRYVITGTTGGVLLDEAALGAAGHTPDEAAALGAAALTQAAWIAVAVPRASCATLATAETDSTRKRLLDALVRSTYAERSGHILHAFKEGFIESGSLASHGSPHAQDSAVPLILRGRGFQHGLIDNTSVSPAIIATAIAAALALPATTHATEPLPTH